MLDRLILWGNRQANKVRRSKAPAENVLLLVPHCLQRSVCQNNILHDVDRCERCGQCDVDAILRLRDELGVQCSLAGGGKEALAAVTRDSVHIVVAVACERELAAGITAAFPKPVIAVPNRTPNGPCRDTRVSEDAVRTALMSVIDR